jgi:hypothetical protein
MYMFFAALGNPLNSLTPTTQFGEIIDIIMATWSLVLASTVMGMIGGLHAAETFANKMQGMMVHVAEETGHVVEETSSMAHVAEQNVLKTIAGRATVFMFS